MTIIIIVLFASCGFQKGDQVSERHPPPTTVKNNLCKVGVLKEQTKLTSKGFSGIFPLETMATVEGHITVVHYSAVKRTSRGGNRLKSLVTWSSINQPDGSH